MPTYAIRELNLPQSIGFTAAVLAAALQTIAVPFVGVFVDKVGQTRVMIGAAILFMVTAYPAFVLLGAAPSLGVLIGMVCWISLLKSFFSGALPSLMAKTFPVATRVSGMSLSYNISVPIFGGFAPFFAQSLIDLTGSKLAPSYYMIATAALSLVALLVMAPEISVVGEPADGKRQTTNWDGIVAVVCRLICAIRRRLQRQPFIGNSSLPVARFSGQTDTYCLPFS
jgi:MHS family proline/betaine transporter-like MFS transporter